MIKLELQDQALQQALAGVAARLGNMEPVMNRIAHVMDEGTRQHFEHERGPDGQRWAPLADATLLADMRRASPGGLLTKRGNTRAKAVKALAQKKILQRTGRLAHEIGREITPMAAMLTSVQPYAATHQFGDPRRNIPARPFFGFSEAIKAGIIDAATDHLSGIR